MKLTQSAGKRVRTLHHWFWFHFWLDEKMAQVFKPIVFRGKCKTNYFSTLRPRPHVSGYFWIRNFFFPDTASVHTHLANSAANPGIFATCGRENFWIRKEKVADSKVSGYGWMGPEMKTALRGSACMLFNSGRNITPRHTSSARAKEEI